MLPWSGRDRGERRLAGGTRRRSDRRAVVRSPGGTGRIAGAPAAEPRMRGVPRIGRILGPPQEVPGMRARRLLRQLSRTPRMGARRHHGPSRGPLPGARGPLGLVLSRRSVPGPGRRLTACSVVPARPGYAHRVIMSQQRALEDARGRPGPSSRRAAQRRPRRQGRGRRTPDRDRPRPRRRIRRRDHRSRPRRAVRAGSAAVRAGRASVAAVVLAGSLLLLWDITADHLFHRPPTTCFTGRRRPGGQAPRPG